MLLCVDYAANFISRFTVNSEIVLFATMLLDLWHDFLFTTNTDLPIAVFWSPV